MRKINCVFDDTTAFLLNGISRRELFIFWCPLMAQKLKQKAEHCQRIALKIQSINNILVKTLNKELLVNIKSKPLRYIKNMAPTFIIYANFIKYRAAGKN